MDTVKMIIQAVAIQDIILHLLIPLFHLDYLPDERPRHLNNPSNSIRQTCL
jgi:hypothetical protein